VPDRIAARVAREELARFVTAAIRRAGGDTASAEAVKRALVGASLRGVDSHGVRLLPDYVNVLADSRVNGAPRMTFERRAPGIGYLDGDNGLGHPVGYRAIEHGIALAEETGIAAVTVGRSTHFGPAGAYPLEAAERGYIALAFCNTDKIVLPFDGERAFHGTNPMSLAAPVPGERPYLIDMATSAIPWNRVLQFGALGQPLPPEVVVDAAATPTQDAGIATALLPLGGSTYGYKGAALASMVELLCGALTGVGFSHSVPEEDEGESAFAAPRGLGQVFLVMKPSAFLPQTDYEARITAYLADLRSQPAKPGKTVMAPGDREWAIEAKRSQLGVPIDPAVWEAFAGLARRLDIDSPSALA